MLPYRSIRIRKIVPQIKAPANDGVLTVMDEMAVPEEIMIADAVNIPDEFVTEETDVTDLINEFSIEALPKALKVGNDDIERSPVTGGYWCTSTVSSWGCRVPEEAALCRASTDALQISTVLTGALSLRSTIFSKESDYEEIQESLKFVGSRYSTSGWCIHIYLQI